MTFVTVTVSTPPCLASHGPHDSWKQAGERLECQIGARVQMLGTGDERIHPTPNPCEPLPRLPRAKQELQGKERVQGEPNPNPNPLPSLAQVGATVNPLTRGCVREKRGASHGPHESWK